MHIIEAQLDWRAAFRGHPASYDSLLYSQAIRHLISVSKLSAAEFHTSWPFARPASWLLPSFLSLQTRCQSVMSSLQQYSAWIHLFGLKPLAKSLV